MMHTHKGTGHLAPGKFEDCPNCGPNKDSENIDTRPRLDADRCESGTPCRHSVFGAAFSYGAGTKDESLKTPGEIVAKIEEWTGSRYDLSAEIGSLVNGYMDGRANDRIRRELTIRACPLNG